MKEGRLQVRGLPVAGTCSYTSHVEAPAGNAVGYFASSSKQLPPRVCKARSCRLSGAPPSEAQGLKLSVLQSSTLAIWKPNPCVSPATSPVRFWPCSGSDASRVGNPIRAPTAVAPEPVHLEHHRQLSTTPSHTLESPSIRTSNVSPPPPPPHPTTPPPSLLHLIHR